jgi:hypothetical protein
MKEEESFDARQPEGWISRPNLGKTNRRNTRGRGWVRLILPTPGIILGLFSCAFQCGYRKIERNP